MGSVGWRRGRRETVASRIVRIGWVWGVLGWAGVLSGSLESFWRVDLVLDCDSDLGVDFEGACCAVFASFEASLSAFKYSSTASLV